MSTSSCVRGLTLLVVSISVVLGAADPFVGTWQLNVQQSSFAPGTCPKRMVIQMDPVGDGVRYRSETTYASGYSSRSEYTALYDGREVMVTGVSGLLTPVALKRLAPNVVVASYRRAFQVIATSRRVISEDGRVMTITTTSADRDGKEVTTIGVYERSIPAESGLAPRLASLH